MNKEKVQKHLLQKMMDAWIADNPDLLEDIQRLAGEIVLFNSKWGTKLKSSDGFICPKCSK